MFEVYGRVVTYAAFVYDRFHVQNLEGRAQRVSYSSVDADVSFLTACQATYIVWGIILPARTIYTLSENW